MNFLTSISVVPSIINISDMDYEDGCIDEDANFRPRRKCLTLNMKSADGHLDVENDTRTERDIRARGPGRLPLIFVSGTGPIPEDKISPATKALYEEWISIMSKSAEQREGCPVHRLLRDELKNELLLQTRSALFGDFGVEWRGAKQRASSILAGTLNPKEESDDALP